MLLLRQAAEEGRDPRRELPAEEGLDRGEYEEMTTSGDGGTASSRQAGNCVFKEGENGEALARHSSPDLTACFAPFPRPWLLSLSHLVHAKQKLFG